MFEYETKVRYSETDENGKLTLASIVNYLQDCTYFHSESLGAGEKFLLEQGKIWVLASWRIVIHQYPQVCDDIIIRTNPYDHDKIFAYRSFSVVDKKQPQNVYIQANSAWVLADVKTGRTKKIQDSDIEVYGLGSPADIELEKGKIELHGEGEKKTPIKVENHHLDSNHHVNNGQYIQIALSQIGKECSVIELRAEYRKQAVQGDVMYPVVYENAENGNVVVSLNDEAEKPYAVISIQTA